MTSFARWLTFLEREVPSSGLALFRVLFGTFLAVSTLRWHLYGWVDEYFVRPRFFFTYPGFDWLAVPSAGVVHAVFWALPVLALCIALGLFYRVTSVLFLLAFSLIQLWDVTNYINHYYLALCLAFLLTLLPLHRVGSVDAWIFPKLRRRTLPLYCTYALRAQVGVVYFYAGIAKLHADWLLSAEPLHLWLRARAHLPLVSLLCEEAWFPYAMSWAGFLFDTTIVFFLLSARTRRYAYGVVLGFHAVTGYLFPVIGMFPFLMSAFALVFFPPDFPAVLLSRVRAATRLGSTPHRVAPCAAPPLSQRTSWVLLPVAAWLCLQVALPLRHIFYPGPTLWHEEGMRFSWRVMAREKNGSVTYYARNTETGVLQIVSPSRYLDARQLREFSTQPDLIVQLARHVAKDLQARHGARFEVRADALCSLNGRPMEHLIDPNVDLAAVKTTWAPASYIVRAPKAPQPLLAGF